MFTKRLIATALPALLVAGSAQGQIQRWILGPSFVGDWFDDANWYQTVPAPGHSARIDNRGTAVFDGNASLYNVVIGDTWLGKLVFNGGRMELANSMLLGGVPNTATGRFEMHGGELIIQSQLSISSLGPGYIDMTGGLIEASSIDVSSQQSEAIFTQSGGVVRSGRVTINSSIPTHDRAYYLSNDARLETDRLEVRQYALLSLSDDSVVEVLDGAPDGLVSVGGLITLSDNASLTARRITLGGDGSQLLQNGGSLNAGGLILDEGSTYLSIGGTIQAEQISQNSGQSGDPAFDSRFVMIGGSLNTDLEIDASGNAWTANIEFEATNATLSGALDVEGSNDNTADFVQHGGTADWSTARVWRRAFENANSIYTIDNAHVTVHESLLAAADFDFVGSSGILEIAPRGIANLDSEHSSSDPGTQFLNAQNATLRLGQNAIVQVPVGMNIHADFGTVEDHGAFILKPASRSCFPRAKTSISNPSSLTRCRPSLARSATPGSTAD